MIRVKVIERRLSHGWETLLEVNGVIGRAEDMLCLEERPAPKPYRPPTLFTVMTPGPGQGWMRDRYIPATRLTAEFASFVET